MKVLEEGVGQGNQQKNLSSEQIFALREENFSKPSQNPRKYHDEEFFMVWDNKRPREDNLCRGVY